MRELLKLAEIPRSTFYYNLKNMKKEDKYKVEKDEILSIFNENKGRYGYRRITLEMRNRGYIINHKTVARLMQIMGLQSIQRPKRRYNSYQGTIGKIADNLLKRDFKAEKPNQKWATDVTEFKVNNDKLYLSPIVDLFNGEVISFNLSRHPVFNQVVDMLEKAFDKIPDNTNLILHSDQGWQYQMKQYQYLLEQKILELDEGGDAKWLIKSLSEDQVEVLKKSLKDDIHEFSKVPCLTDENFVGNASGVAMKYKLLGLEQLGKTKERYFKKGLRKRLKLIENLEGIRANNIKSSDIDISMKRSLPVDDELLARIAQETEGFISWETRIKNYDPEIDINEERKRLEEEKKRNIEEQQKAFGFPYDKSDNPNNEDENTDKEDDVVNEE